MLYEAVKGVDLRRVLLARQAYRPIPPARDRAAWAALAPEVRAHYLGAGQALQGMAWPPLPAARYMDFARDGNRKRYENPYFKRRSALFALTVAECVGGEGTYLTDIIDGLWAICEESTWVVPAHNNHSAHAPRHAPNALPDLAEEPPYIDLFAAETASLLAWIWALLGEELARVSPLIPRRLEREVQRRVLAPYRLRDDFGWLGLAHEQPVNNWNPWINSNVLAAALLMEEEPALRAELVRKVARSTQRFLDGYAPDGGCDEGPAYFNVAGASLLDILELLFQATGGAIDLYKAPLIRNMARYPMHAHIAGRYHVNFADAAARVSPDAMLLLRAAQAMGDELLADYARGALNAGFAACPYQMGYGQIFRRLSNLFHFRPEAFAGAPLVAPREHYFAGIQVACARERAHEEAGLFFAAKGGHNAESHNHNDVGNYIIYLDGEPVICDAGVETYRKQTFSERRYEIWTMQSGYHNTAVINGGDQLPGEAYAAREAAFAAHEDAVCFRLDMAGAYAPAAHVLRYAREIALSRAAREITVCDEYELSQLVQPLVLPLLCAIKPRLAPGELTFDTAKGALVLRFDAQAFEATLAEIVLADEQLRAAWGQGALYRVLLTQRRGQARGTLRLTYAAQ